MKKKMYRITLKNNNSFLAKEVAIAAAYSNGKEYLSLHQLEGIAKLKRTEQPATNVNVTIHHIGNSLCIDDKTESLLVIEEVEIMELVTQDELTEVLN